MRTKQIAMMLLAAAVCAFTAFAQEPPAEPAPAQEPAAAEEAPATPPQAPSPFTTDAQKESYMLGARLGTQFRSFEAEIDVEIFTKAFKDALEGKDLAMTEQEMMAVNDSFRMKMMQKQETQRKAEGEKNLAAGNEFLAAKAQEQGVQKTESGLLYEVIQEGTGRTPADADMVKVNYEVASIDGEVYDSSFQRGEPVDFPVSGDMIEGWAEALKLMKEGAKYKVYLPASLAYKAEGRGQIPPNAALVFTIELLNIVEDYKGMQEGAASAPETAEPKTE